jgi:hypothetical protein
LLAIEIVLKGPWYRVISPRLFQYIAGFTENSNDYIIVWDPTPPKASSDYSKSLDSSTESLERDGQQIQQYHYSAGFDSTTEYIYAEPVMLSVSGE